MPLIMFYLLSLLKYIDVGTDQALILYWAIFHPFSSWLFNDKRILNCI